MTTLPSNPQMSEENSSKDQNPRTKGPVRKSVSFQNVSIREHARDLAIHPSVTCGPALGLGWEFRDLAPCELEQYEGSREARRTYTELQLSRRIREDLLLEEGISRGELKKAVQEMDVARRQRRSSVALQEVEEWVVAFEWTARKFRKVLGKRSSYKKEEQKLWMNAQKWTESKKKKGLGDSSSTWNSSMHSSLTGIVAR